jgi:diguanylate cyclase (GGDEF)-like protein
MSTVPDQIPLSSFKLCKKAGLDQQAIDKRLTQMNLVAADIDTSSQVIDHVIIPFHARIMDEFYEFVFSQADMRPFIGQEKNIRRLKQTQTEYLLSFGNNYNQPEYFEYRLRVGAAHARINMPMHLYIAAYSKMQCLLHQALRDSDITDQALMVACHQFINKIIFLDISLAIDAYNMTTINELSESVIQLEEEKDLLSNQLMHDTLTGALSRAYIIDVLGKQISIFDRSHKQNLSVALFDIDFFKKINDTYGHQVGDILLVKFVDTINYVIRSQDYLGRYGGEEFLFLTINTEPEDALHLVERIRASIENTVYQINEHEIKITVSIGLAHITVGDDIDSIIERADSALYQAKNSGRNQTIEIK